MTLAILIHSVDRQQICYGLRCICIAQPIIAFHIRHILLILIDRVSVSASKFFSSMCLFTSHRTFLYLFLYDIRLRLWLPVYTAI